MFDQLIVNNIQSFVKTPMDTKTLLAFANSTIASNTREFIAFIKSQTREQRIYLLKEKLLCTFLKNRLRKDILYGKMGLSMGPSAWMHFTQILQAIVLYLKDGQKEYAREKKQVEHSDTLRLKFIKKYKDKELEDTLWKKLLLDRDLVLLACMVNLTDVRYVLPQIIVDTDKHFFQKLIKQRDISGKI